MWIQACGSRSWLEVIRIPDCVERITPSRVLAGDKYGRDRGIRVTGTDKDDQGSWSRQSVVNGLFNNEYLLPLPSVLLASVISICVRVLIFLRLFR